MLSSAEGAAFVRRLVADLGEQGCASGALLVDKVAGQLLAGPTIDSCSPEAGLGRNSVTDGAWWIC
nr:hypothetical protein [Tardiphaga sp.]